MRQKKVVSLPVAGEENTTTNKKSYQLFLTAIISYAIVKINLSYNALHSLFLYR